MFFSPLHNGQRETPRRQGKNRLQAKKRQRSVSPSLEQLEERSLLSGSFGDAQLAAINTLVASGKQAVNSLVASGEQAINPLIAPAQQAVNSLVAPWEQAVNPLIAAGERAVNSLIVSWEMGVNTLDSWLGLPSLFPSVGTGQGSPSPGASNVSSNVNVSSAAAPSNVNVTSDAAASNVIMTPAAAPSNVIVTPDAAPSNVNVSSDAAVTRSGFRYDFVHHEFVQTLTITNTSGQDLNGPLDLALTNLSSNATLANSSGKDSAGDPYLTATTGSLAANQSASVVLDLTDPTFKPITYGTQLWQNLTPIPPLSVQITGLPSSLSDPEGTTINLGSDVTSPLSGLQYQWKVTQNATGNTYASGTSSNFSFTLGDSGSYTVNLSVTAVGNISASASATMTATEATPTVSLSGPSVSLTSGSTATFTASTTDSSLDAPAGFSYSWSFGDGSPVQTVTGGPAVAQMSHTYDATGDYTVTVTATDQDGLSSSATTTVVVTTANAPNEPLLHSSDLQYLGAFRVPDYSNGNGTMAYGGTDLAYNPANNSVFLVGGGLNGVQPIAEISIPSTIVNSSNLNDLTTSTILQPWTNVLSRFPQPLSGATDGAPIGGLLVDNGQLLGTDYAYYSGAYTQTTSMFTLSSLNLSTATVQGLYPVQGGRLASGYLAAVPSAWQGVLGYPDLTGLSDVSLYSTISAGPAALGFNPADLSYTATAPSTTFLDYPLNHPLGPYTGPADPLQNGGAGGPDGTGIHSAVWVPGTNTLLFFGETATNYVTYGPPGSEGPWSLNNGAAYQVWAYNANDFLAVKEGTMQPWQVQPYDVWNFTAPVGVYGPEIGGVAFDESTNRLYVSLMEVDRTQNWYDPLPLIQVYQVNVPSSPPVAAAPQVGTLGAAPVTLPSPLPAAWTSGTGSVSAGTPVLVTAGNVYALTPGANITQVAFYLDTNNDGVLDSSDQFLGDGTPSTIPNAQHNYTYTLSTAGLTAGTYTLFAQAKDSDGQLSNVVETTLIIS